MKVLVVHNKYLSKHIGGEDIVYLTETESLRQALGKANVFNYDVCNDQLSKIKLPFTIWFSLKHYRAIKQLVREHGIDVVHVHNFFPLLTPSVFIAAKHAGAKVFHTLHNFRWGCISGILYRDEVGVCELCVGKTLPLSGIKFRCYRNSTSQSLLAQLAFFFYKLIGSLDFIDTFIVLTNFQKNKVLSLGIPSEKVRRKPHAMNPLPVTVAEKSGYVFVGRIEAYKGIFKLLGAWKELDPSFVLTVVGEGEVTDEMRLPNVRYVGKKSHAETLRLINESKFLIHPSLVYETFGLTILEAMSMGTPVIGFDIGPRSEFITDGETGFIAGIDSLAKTISLSAMYHDYLGMSAKARKQAALFNEDLIVRRLVSLYEGQT